MEVGNRTQDASRDGSGDGAEAETGAENERMYVR